MKIAILGAGNGGLAAAVDLTLQGYRVKLWNRSESSLHPFVVNEGINYSGVLGEGIVSLEMISTNLAKVIEDSELLMICLPTLALGNMAEKLSRFDHPLPPILLNPGHTGGALEFITAFKSKNQNHIALAECSTLTYVARKQQDARINISGIAKHVWAAALPGGEAALKNARKVYPFIKILKDVLGTGLANVNMVLHPPGAILGTSWIESTNGDFTFYVEGLTEGVGKILEQLDKERLSVAKAFGHDLPDLFHEMQMIGTIEVDALPSEGLAQAIRNGQANRSIKAPDSLNHRYFKEDFWYGIKPFLELANIANVQVPIAQSLMNLAVGILDQPDKSSGRTKSRMGIDNFTKEELLNFLISNN